MDYDCSIGAALELSIAGAAVSTLQLAVGLGRLWLTL